MRAAAAAAGFNLVETMVALLILSVGLLGIAALQGRALAVSRFAMYRSQAVALAADLSDRIRANPGALLAYADAPAELPCDVPTRNGGGACQPAEMAAYDLFVWGALLERTLPKGSGRVAVDAAVDPARYRVVIAWIDPASAAPLDLSIDFQLTQP